MPKLLFSRIQFHEIKDLMPNVKRPRRIDILNENRHNKDFRGLMKQTINNKTSPSNLSLLTDHKPHMNLEKFLKDKKCLVAFRTFLQSEYSQENIDFWVACEDFRSTTSPAELRRKAEAMYQGFIQPTACTEINVDHHTREKIKKSLDKPSPSCFDEAQKQVYLLMENDSWPRFLHSDAYRRLKHKSKTKWYI